MLIPCIWMNPTCGTMYSQWTAIEYLLMFVIKITNILLTAVEEQCNKNMFKKYLKKYVLLVSLLSEIHFSILFLNNLMQQLKRDTLYMYVHM